MGTTVEFSRPDGKRVSGYLAQPASAAGAPNLVVIQEWWGLNDQIRGVADRLAAQGYRALVPDLYRGKSTVEAAEAEHLMNDLDFADAAGQDIRGAADYLRSSGGKCGVMGYCMGGALTVLSSMFVPGCDAAVIFYGYPPLEFVDASKISIPLQGHYGTRDVLFPTAGVDALEAKLRAGDVDFEFHRYDADHAFCNETQVEGHKLMPTLGYAPEAAALAWDRCLGFFAKHLR